MAGEVVGFPSGQVVTAKYDPFPEGKVFKGKDYLAWGRDNQEPLRWIDYYQNSGSLMTCVNRLATLIEGNGFNNEAFYKSKVNNRGEKADQILKKVSHSIALGEAFVLHTNLNAAGEVTEVYHVPFQKWRPGLPDDADYIGKVWIVNNVDKLKTTYGLKRTDALQYDTFNPNPDVVLAQIEEAGSVDKYKGQIYSWFNERPGSEYFPRPVWLSCLDDIIAEVALKRSKKRDITRGFSARMHITRLGTSEPTEEIKAIDRANYTPFVGEDGSSILLEYAANKEVATLINKIEAPDADKMYAYSEESVKNNIRQMFSIPNILYGEAIAGKLGTSQEFEEAITYVQKFVVNTYQRAIEEAFTHIFSKFHNIARINPTKDFKIQNLTLGNGQATTNQS